MQRLTGEDGRELLEKADDAHAQDVAVAVHAETGETLTLTPFKLNGKTDEWELDEDGAVTYPGGEPAKASKRPAAKRKSNGK